MEFSRYLNPHISLKVIEYFKLPPQDKLYFQTRLYNKLPDHQKIKDQQQSDNLTTKLQDIQPLIEQLNKKQSQKQVADYIQDNLWLVEQSYQALIILFDSGHYEKAYDIVEKLYPYVEQNDKIFNLRVGFQWARLLNRVIKAFDSEEDRAKRINQAFDDLRDLARFDECNDKNFRARAQLLYTGLILMFLGEQFQTFLEIFATDQYFEVVFTLQTNLLYYYAVALINARDDYQGYIGISQIANSKKYTKSALVNYLDLLTNQFDFQLTNNCLLQVEEEAKQDVFIAPFTNALLQSCKIYFFQVYAKIFTTVEISQFQKYLNCNAEQAELWIVNTIRLLQINAKIDPQQGKIYIIREEANSQNDNLLQSIRELIPKSNMLISNLERIMSAKN
ncbi:hypothetical protein pb186bvf_015145 [Paramecium bursaria]